MQTVIGKKIDQKQMFLTDGTRIPVTVVAVEDMPVVAVKTQEKSGYTALQVGYGSRKKTNQVSMGQVKKANLSAMPLVLREIKTADEATLPAVGDLVKPEEVLKAGDIVKVTGTSKGKGFAGVVKRHNFRGGPRTHGQSDRERAPGSIGQTTTPGRVYRGKRMAGRMGQDTVTLANLLVMDITESEGKKTLLIKGLVPGGVNSVITVEKTGEMSEKKFVPLNAIEETKKTPAEEQVEVAEEQQVATEQASADSKAMADKEVEAVAAVETVETEVTNEVEAPKVEEKKEEGK